MQQTSAIPIQTGNVPEVVAGLPIVNVWYRGRSIGLYRVKEIGQRGIVLNHGGISFPVGTLLDVVDFQHLVPDVPFRRLSTTVVDTTYDGIRLAGC